MTEHKPGLLRLKAVGIRLRLEGLFALLVLCGFLFSASRALAATLSGAFANLAAGTETNLSNEGQLDWRHWGRVTAWSTDRKYGVAPQITSAFFSDEFFLDGPYSLEGGTIAFSWTNGTPPLVTTNTTGGVYIFGDRINPGSIQTGFRIQCPADTTPKRLKVYVGTSGAAATFTATLAGATTYNDTSLNGSTGPLYRVYTLDFQANSPGQTLTVNFLSAANNWVDQYLILQAATLSGTNAPPQVVITAPADGTILPAPASFALDAVATDSDGTVTNLTLLLGSAPLGESASGSFNATLNNQPAGSYNLLGVATDNNGLSMTSFPARVYVITNGGTLSGSADTPSTSVDLTAEGTADWAHWGLAGPASFNRKSGVTPLIPNVTLLNTSPTALSNYANNLVAFSWSDGTPTAEAVGSTTGAFLYATNNPPSGFQLTVPATNLLRRLKVYVGLYSGQGRLDAWLDDFSAPPYSDSSLVYGYSAYAVYTLTFSSANPGANLIVTWTPEAVFDPFFGNLTWQAATLWQQPPPPALQVVVPPPAPGQFALSFYAHTGVDYTVQFTDFLDPTNWQTLSNLSGTGGNVLVADPAPAPWQRYYRALAQ